MHEPILVSARKDSAVARWGVLFLLFLSIAVNLLDRQVLSVLAPTIRDELHLSNTEYSYIILSFLLGMTLAQIPAGIFLDRRGARFGLPFLMLWWSAANALHATARSVAQFCAFRFLLGVVNAATIREASRSSRNSSRPTSGLWREASSTAARSSAPSLRHL